MYQSTTTLEPLQQPSCERTELTKLTSSQAVFPAKMLAAPALEKALRTAMGKLLAADCGVNMQDSLASLDQNSCWRKMFGAYYQPLLISNQEETSESFCGTWPAFGMMHNGIVTVLKPLVRRTKGKESSSWPTPRANKVGGTTSEGYGLCLDEAVNGGRKAQNWPTPRSREGNAGEAGSKGAEHNAKRGYLDGVVLQNWPTPAARDWKNGTAIDGARMKRKLKLGYTIDLNDRVLIETEQKGQLNADWTEILMGLPIGWTDIDCEEPQPWPGWPAPMNAGMWRTPEAGDSCDRVFACNSRGEPKLSGQAKIMGPNTSGQYPYEPPRVVVGQKNRAKRLKCLGNGCCPAQIYPIFKAITEIERVRK